MKNKLSLSQSQTSLSGIGLAWMALSLTTACNVASEVQALKSSLSSSPFTVTTQEDTFADDEDPEPQPSSSASPLPSPSPSASADPGLVGLSSLRIRILTPGGPRDPVTTETPLHVMVWETNPIWEVTQYDSQAKVSFKAFSGPDCSGEVVPDALSQESLPFSGSMAESLQWRILSSKVQSVQASSGGRQVCSEPLQITRGEGLKLQFTVQPRGGNTTDDPLTIQPEVTIYDEDGKIKTDGYHLVFLSANSNPTDCGIASDIGGGVGGESAVVAVNGVAKFKTLKVYRAANVRLRAFVGYAQTCSDSFSVNPGKPASLAFTTGVSSPMTTDTVQPVTLKLYDALMNVVATNSSSVVMLSAHSSEDCSGDALENSLNTSSIAVKAGIADLAQFRVLNIRVRSVKASLGALSACAGALSVGPGAVSSLAFTRGFVSPVTADDAQTVSVSLYDSQSNLITTDSVSKVDLRAYPSSNCDGGGGGSPSVFLPSSSAQARNGVATFEKLQLISATIRSVKATVGSVSSCSGPIIVNHGALATIDFTHLDTPIATTQTQEVTAALFDRYKNIVTSDSSSVVTMTAYSGPYCNESLVENALPVNTAVANAGVALFSGWRVLQTSVQSFRIDSGLLSKCYHWATVRPGPPMMLSILANDHQTGQPGTLLLKPLKVLVQDAYENPIGGVFVRWEVLSGQGSVRNSPLYDCSPTYSNDGLGYSISFQGLASCSPVLGPVATENRFRATIDGTQVSVTFIATGTGYSKMSPVAGLPGAPGAGQSLTYFKDRLYGVSSTGGSYSAGYVFSSNLDGSDFKVLRSFDPSTEGGRPGGSLLAAGDALYGVLSEQGLQGGGSLYRLSGNGASLVILKSFNRAQTDPRSPKGSLLLDSGQLFGVVSEGGDQGAGAIYRINLDGSGFGVIHHMDPVVEGSNPQAGLLMVSGRLYGTAAVGGRNGFGSVYHLTRDGSNFQVDWSFSNGSDGASPVGELSVEGNFVYGLTGQGGSFGKGALFRLRLDGSSFESLYSFGTLSKDGANPAGGRPVVMGGRIYGALTAGADYGKGSLFSINLDGTGYRNLVSFPGQTGAPSGGDAPILVNETLYGMTRGLAGGTDAGLYSFGLSLP